MVGRVSSGRSGTGERGQRIAAWVMLVLSMIGYLASAPWLARNMDQILGGQGGFGVSRFDRALRLRRAFGGRNQSKT